MEISQRLRQLPESPLRLLASLVAEAEKKGRVVYRLNLGEPDEQPPAGLSEAFSLRPDQKIPYTPSEGEPELISAWTDCFNEAGLHVKLDDFLVTNGASEALLIALAAAADPGQEILLFEPFYPNFLSLANLLGLKIKSCPLAQTDSGYCLPGLEQIEAALGPNTRVILIDNPSNPSGTVHSTEELHGLVELSRKHKLWLIVDEVYRGLVYESLPVSRVPGYTTGRAPEQNTASALAFQEEADNIVVVDSVSKRFSLCGLRIGCLVSRNRDFMTAAKRLAQSRLSTALPSQRLALAALRQQGTYVPALVESFRERREIVRKALIGFSSIELNEPAGAFYVFLRIPKLDDCERFSRWLITDFVHENQTVCVAPGTGFYLNPADGRQKIRIAFVLEPAKLERSLTVLKAGLSNYLQK